MGLKLFGKNILQVYTQKIMKIEYKTAAGNPEKSSYTLRKINNDIITEELAPIGTTVTVSNLKHLLRVNGSRCEGFIFGADDTPIGTIWVMYRGADDLEYRIRNIDAYIFDVYVNNLHRGKGYAGEMIRQLMEYLHDKGINTAYLAVSMSNSSALRAYKKTGFTTVADKKFAGFLKINIPYHKL